MRHLVQIQFYAAAIVDAVSRDRSYSLCDLAGEAKSRSHSHGIGLIDLMQRDHALAA